MRHACLRLRERCGNEVVGIESNYRNYACLSMNIFSHDSHSSGFSNSIDAIGRHNFKG